MWITLIQTPPISFTDFHLLHDFTNESMLIANPTIVTPVIRQIINEQSRLPLTFVHIFVHTASN